MESGAAPLPDHGGKRAMDEEFLALDPKAWADTALSSAQRAGASWADVRLVDNAHRSVALRDGRMESSGAERSVGLGVRVIADGAWGFAATAELHPDEVARAARRAVALAQATAALVTTPVELAPEPVHEGRWVAPYEIDPVDVADDVVVATLAHWSSQLAAAHPVVTHTEATFRAARERLFYADSAGTRTWQQRVRCEPEVTAIAVGEDGFEDLRTTLPPAGIGWEHTSDPRLAAELALMGDLLAERVAAPALPPGAYDLVIAPSNLWLTIHESVGHATEYDRAIGFEANYAGTSFARPDLLGTLRYGSPLMHIVGDRTAAGGLATVGWDHEGVAARSWDLVRDGVLVGYQLDRWGAALAGVPASNGCSYADDGGHVPLQRMPNVSLQPAADGPDDIATLVAGVTDGLLVVGDKSWSIDMNRRNFQFTAQRFHRIRGGRLVGQVKDVAYQSDTLSFWNRLAALGGPGTYELGGALNCGKGQPGQVAAVSHGCPAAVFTGVNVLRTDQEDR